MYIDIVINSHTKTQAQRLALFIYLQFVFYLSTLPEVLPPMRVRMRGIIAYVFKKCVFLLYVVLVFSYYKQ